MKHPDSQSLKFYQAGNTRNHGNTNIKSALEAGAKRISNCSNILQFSEIIPRCSKTCFEINPIYQILSRSSGREDIRLSVGAVLLGLKVPVSLGWDYCGILGVETCNSDISMMVVSSNWSLKELKLVFLNSIEYSTCTEGEKIAKRK